MRYDSEVPVSACGHHSPLTLFLYAYLAGKHDKVDILTMALMWMSCLDVYLLAYCFLAYDAMNNANARDTRPGGIDFDYTAMAASLRYFEPRAIVVAAIFAQALP